MATQLRLDIQQEATFNFIGKAGTRTQLTQRDLDVLATIHDYGGVLTTVQLATLFWPPDVQRRLHSWSVPPQHIAEWCARYTDPDLHEVMEMLKWGLHLNRLRRRRRKSDDGLRAWLLEQRSKDPATFAELERFMDEIAAVTPAGWLAEALTRQRRPPKLFGLRPRHPSEFVSSACKHRLRLLGNLGLLDAHEQPTRLSKGRAQTCWFLSRDGRNLLAQVRRVRVKDLDWREAGAYGLFHLNHRLLINDVRISFVLACGQTGHELRTWIDDNRLRRLLGNAKVVLRRQRRNPVNGEMVIKEETHALKLPDGYFVLALKTGELRHCFLELDNQTLTLDYSDSSRKDYAEKIRTMSAFYRGGGYQEAFPEADDSMWYLTVTSGGQRRLENLKATAEKLFRPGNRAVDRYWFARLAALPTWEDYYAAGPFQPIWLRGGQSRHWRLDEPFSAEEQDTS